MMNRNIKTEIPNLVWVGQPITTDAFGIDCTNISKTLLQTFLCTSKCKHCGRSFFLF